MDKERNQIKLNIKKSLEDLRSEINNKKYLKFDQLFRGADIKVVNSKSKKINKTVHWMDNDLIIETPHAYQLSWIIFKLRDLFYLHNIIDYNSKYEFFGRLGRSALEFHKNNSSGLSKELMFNVLDEAKLFLNDTFTKYRN